MLLLRKRAGLTIIELMVVVAIIAVLVSIAVPTYAKIRSDAQSRICQANLKQLNAAIEQWAFENEISEGTSLSSYEDEIYSYLRGKRPSCPWGLKYVLTNLGDNPQVICASGLAGHEYP